MKKYFGFTAVSLLGAMLISGVLLSLTTESSAAQNPVTEISYPEQTEAAYLLRDYNGYLAVFIPDKTEPEMIFQVQVRTLPEYDQKALQNGISVSNYKELIERIEDFIS